MLYQMKINFSKRRKSKSDKDEKEEEFDTNHTSTFTSPLSDIDQKKYKFANIQSALDHLNVQSARDEKSFYANSDSESDQLKPSWIKMSDQQTKDKQISKNEDEATNRETDSNNLNTERLEACSTKTSSKSLLSNPLNSSMSSLSKIILEKKEKEISKLVEEIERLQETINNVKEKSTSELNEKNIAIKELKEKLDQQKDYQDIKHELSILKADLGQFRPSSNSDRVNNKSLKIFLLEKVKALQNENAALKAANAELAGSIPRHLIPPFLPPLQNVEAFGLSLGEEIVNSYAKAFRRSDHSSDPSLPSILNNAQPSNSSASPSRPTSADDQKSITSDSSPINSSAINCNDESELLPNCASSHTSLATSSNNTTVVSDHIIKTSTQSLQGSLAKLQDCLRQNMDKFMNETLNTLNISRCVRELLSIHNIGQRLFARFVLGLSQGTVSELLSKPKPWDKLTEKGRDSYRKMHAWAADENCINLLKSLVPRKGKETSSLKQEDPAAEEKIRQILSEAQGAMLAPIKPNLSLRSSSSIISNGEPMMLKSSDKLLDPESSSDNGDERNENRNSPSLLSAYSNSLASLRKMCKSKDNDHIPHEMMVRLYQEELAKILRQQVEEGFRHPQGVTFERNSEQIRQAFNIYHQELSRLSQIAQSSGASDLNASETDVIARITAAAALMNGANYLNLPHLIESNLSLEARLRSDKASTNSLSRDDNTSKESFSSSDDVRQHNSAFSLVRPKQENSGQSSIISNSGALDMGNTGNGAEDLSAAASPLQRMQSITNSLLSQSSVAPVSSTPHRPAKAVLPPITQNQFDHYNNLNTEDIVKKVKEQLSQYSISQRLFGESVLGLSQGSVSDLLARPKPWHMLTQKGREPFIRMKMFLEDDNAVHKLVASQYKIAPEKLMRTGGYSGNNIIVANTTTSLSNSHSPNNSANLITNASKSSNNLKNSDHIKSLSDNRQTSSPVYIDGSGHLSSGSTPEHTPSINLSGSNSSPPISVTQNYLKRRLDGTNSNRSAIPYTQPSVYEMAALTQDLDTQAITTKIKETLMAHNIGQKIFGEIVLGLSQGSVSELLSKPKPWHMLSIKGREPFIRMQIWLTDAHNIEKLQALKNERREANKKRRTNVDESITPSRSLELSFGLNNNGNNFGNLATLTSSSFNPSHSSTSALINLNSSSYGISSGSNKKPRILFSEEQKEALRLAFGMDPYPSTPTIEFLAQELDLSVRTITNWFHNHRMRLKQVSNAPSEDGNSNSNLTQLTYNLGREGVNLDPVQFRLLLTQRLAEIKYQNNNINSSLNKCKFGGIYGSSLSSHLYANPNSCLSPALSYQEDENGTLDLSMSSQQHKPFSNRSLTEDSEESNISAEIDSHEPVELDLSQSSRIGSSRRKPAVVISSSSRRKPAQPQWVDPGREMIADEEDEFFQDEDGEDIEEVEYDEDEEMRKSDLTEEETEEELSEDKNQAEIINGVCLSQTRSNQEDKKDDTKNDYPVNDVIKNDLKNSIKSNLTDKDEDEDDEDEDEDEDDWEEEQEAEAEGEGEGEGEDKEEVEEEREEIEETKETEAETEDAKAE